jgi:cobalamin biosynthesis protein CbiD
VEEKIEQFCNEIAERICHTMMDFVRMLRNSVKDGEMTESEARHLLRKAGMTFDQAKEMVP